MVSRILGMLDCVSIINGADTKRRGFMNVKRFGLAAIYKPAEA